MLVLALLCALVAGVSSASSADPADELKRQKKEVLEKQKDVKGDIGDAKDDYEHSSKEYAKAKKALDEAEAKLKGAQTYLDETRGQLAVAKARDDEMQAKLAQSELELDQARKALKAGERQLASSESAVQQFTLESLQQGDQGLRAFGDLLRGESPMVYGQRVSLTRSVSDAQVATMERLAASRVMLKINRDAVRRLRDKVEVKRKEAAANLVTKQNLENAAHDQAVVVGKLVTARETAKATANKAVQDDAAKLKALEDDRARLEREAKRLAEAYERELARQAAARAKARAKKGLPPEPEMGTNAALSRPNGGIITSPYGYRVHPVTGVYKLHDGTDFRAACGSPVKAAADGKVISEYYNGGYGNRLILANGKIRGKSIITTYNHLSRYKVGSGATVKRGQVIAYAGTTGYSTGCHLHFMVIADGKTVNPMGWL